MIAVRLSVKFRQRSAQVSVAITVSDRLVFVNSCLHPVYRVSKKIELLGS
jgi:hypothetical protein